MRDAASLLFHHSVLPPPCFPARLPSRHHQRTFSLPVVENTRWRSRLTGPPGAGGKLSTRGRSASPICPHPEERGGSGGDGWLCWPVVGASPGEEDEVEGDRVMGDATRQLFDDRSSREPPPATGADFSSSIVRQLCGEEEESSEEAGSVLRVTAEGGGLKPSLPAYNSLVRGLGRAGDFQGAMDAIGRMREVGLVPVAETYHGLLRAYGKSRMYDEMSKCVRGMMASMSEGCSPNEVTYNMLIVEYARGGLLQRMEAAHSTLLSKRMHLLPSTLVVMLETYADFGALEKMDRTYRRSLSSMAYLKQSLIRKLASVYIENYRFARLEELGNDIASRSGRTFIVWCLLLLASALLSSHKGMESITKEMKIAKVSPHITFTNIVALAHVKMKDFRDLDLLLSQIGASGVKPDLVTVGILVDACSSAGFDGTRVLDVWRRVKFLERTAEMKTDPLVIATFGKGSFLRSCEEQFSALGPKAREKKVWTYTDLIRLVLSNHKMENFS